MHGFPQFPDIGYSPRQGTHVDQCIAKVTKDQMEVLDRVEGSSEMYRLQKYGSSKMQSNQKQKLRTRSDPW